MVTSTGKPITHKDLILQLLDAIQLPRKVAIYKCAAHASGKDFISMGNKKADEEAKRAAAPTNTVDGVYTTEITPTHIDHDISRDMQNNSPKTEKNMWRNNGATQTEAGIKNSLEGKPILTKNVFRFAAILSHGNIHVSTGGMVSTIENMFSTYGFQNYSKIFVLHD